MISIENIIIPKLKKLINRELTKSDYVHTSEFISNDEKQDILDERVALWNKYTTLKSNLELKDSENLPRIQSISQHFNYLLDVGSSLDDIFKCYGNFKITPLPESEELTE